MFIARISALVVGALSILIAILLGPTFNVAYMVGLAFALAAAANLPAILFSLFWKRFNTVGAVTGMATGIIATLVFIIISPSIMTVDPDTLKAGRHLIQAAPIFPLANPGIVSIPLGFLGAYIGTMLSRDPGAEAKYNELNVRANTGLGAEV